MSKEKPTERDGIHAYVSPEALRLKALYEKEAAKRGGSTAAREAIKAEALMLLAEIDAPPAMARMFSVMMGRVKQEPRYSAEFKWLEFILNYEARELNCDFDKARAQTRKTRELTHAKIRDAIMDAIMDANEKEENEDCPDPDPDHVYRRVLNIRNKHWYPDVLAARCLYLKDYDDAESV